MCTPDVPNLPQDEPFRFSTPEGLILCHKILSTRLPFGSHDYQLRGVASILDSDGYDFLGVSATGSGKSAYVYVVLHVIYGILEDSSLCTSVNFPEDPAILVISPTTALEEDQEKKMHKLGLTARAVNSNTKSEVERQGQNIWTVVESQIAVILVSPEMLTTPGFGILLANKHFQARLFAVAVDEVHLLDLWGQTFRPAFREIGYVRARCPRRVVMFAMTATLQNGRDMKSICDILGFREPNFRFIRRSKFECATRCTTYLPNPPCHTS